MGKKGERNEGKGKEEEEEEEKENHHDTSLPSGTQSFMTKPNKYVCSKCPPE